MTPPARMAFFYGQNATRRSETEVAISSIEWASAHTRGPSAKLVPFDQLDGGSCARVAQRRLCVSAKNLSDQ
jgi:hypothetical protein